jgi:hypothetical protein
MGASFVGGVEELFQVEADLGFDRLAGVVALDQLQTLADGGVTAELIQDGVPRSSPGRNPFTP